MSRVADSSKGFAAATRRHGGPTARLCASGGDGCPGARTPKTSPTTCPGTPRIEPCGAVDPQAQRAAQGLLSYHPGGEARAAVGQGPLTTRCGPRQAVQAHTARGDQEDLIPGALKARQAPPGCDLEGLSGRQTGLCVCLNSASVDGGYVGGSDRGASPGSEGRPIHGGRSGTPSGPLVSSQARQGCRDSLTEGACGEVVAERGEPRCAPFQTVINRGRKPLQTAFTSLRMLAACRHSGALDLSAERRVWAA